MTKFKKPVVREVLATEPRSQRPYVVTIDGKVLRIREKGIRTEYVIPYESIHLLGAKMRVNP